MVRETWVQSQVMSYKNFKNVTWYLLAYIQQYKVRINGKVGQSREMSNALPYTSM